MLNPAIPYHKIYLHSC